MIYFEKSHFQTKSYYLLFDNRKIFVCQYYPFGKGMKKMVDTQAEDDETPLAVAAIYKQIEMTLERF